MSFTSGGDIQVGLSLVDSLTPGLRTAGVALAAFEGQAGGVLNRLAGIAGPVAAIGAIATGFITAGRAAAQVQQQVANLNAALNATPQQLALIRQSGLALSQQTQFNDAQIIASQRLLAKAHQDTAAIIAQTPNVLNLASATQSDPTTATRLYVAAQKDFQLATRDSTDEVNILARAIDSSVGDATSMAAGLKQVGPSAKAAGLDLRETASALADLQNAGLQNQSGSALKVFLQHIEHETPQARAEVQKLGLSFYDSSGQLKDYATLLDEIRTKTIGMTDEQRQASLYTIFGSRGAQVANIGAEQGGQGFRDVQDHMAELGDASEIARQKLDTVDGSLHKLGSSLNVVAVQGGSTLLPFFRSASDGAEHLANALSTLNSKSSLIPQTGMGVLGIAGEVFAARQISSMLTTRRAAAAAPDDSAEDAYTAREQARYQQELAQYEQYQARLVAFQQQEIDRRDEYNMRIAQLQVDQQTKLDSFYQSEATRLAEYDAKIEAIEQAHLAKMTELQTAAAEASNKTSTLLSSGYQPGPTLGAAQREEAAVEQRIAAEEDAFQKRIAAQSFNPRSFPAGATSPLPAFEPGKAPGPVEAPMPISLPIVADLTVQEARLAEGGLAALRANATAILQKTGAAIGKVAMPLLIAITAEQILVEPLFDAINKKLADRTLGQGFSVNPFAIDPAQQEAEIRKAVDDRKAMIDKAQKEIDSFNSGNRFQKGINNLFAGPGGEGLGEDQKIIEGATAYIAAAQHQLDQLRTMQQATPQQAVSAETDRLAILVQQVGAGQMTIDKATDSWKGYGSEVGEDLRARLLAAGVAQEKVNQTIKDGTDALEKQAKALHDQIRAEDDLAQSNYEKRQAAVDVGASTEQISRSIYEVTGTGAEASKQQVAEATKEIDDLTKASTKAASDTESAWKSALTAVNALDAKAGKALSISDLSNSADGLQKAQQALASLGKSDSSLDALVGITSQFKQITDAEDKASAAMNSYNLTLNETNRYMKEIGSVTSEFDAALNAAERRQRLGTATDSDTYLIQHKADIYANLDKTTDNLSKKANVDFLGKLQNLPDYEKLADYTKEIVDNYPGGRQQIAIDLQTNVDAAEQIITDWINKKRDPIKIDVNVAPPDYPSSPAGYGSMPTSKPESRYDDMRGGGGNAPPGGPGWNPPGNPNAGTQGFNQFQPLSWSDFEKIVPQNSPLHDQTTYSQLIDETKLHNVDPRYVLAFLAQEGNFSTAGGAGAWQVGAKNPGGLKFAGQAGAHPGATSTEGDRYASFGTYGDYFEAMLNSITGYDAFNKGDAAGTAGTWTKGAQGFANLSPEEQAAVANAKLNYYRQYRGAFTSGGNSGSGSAPTGGPGEQDYQYGVGDPGNRDRRMPWYSPLASYTITQRPFSGAGNSHENLGAYDLAAPTGTPIRASSTGRVVESGYSNAGYGNSEVVDYGNGIQARYGHLSELESKVGDIVKTGQEIGKVGSTGNSTGPHLHFEVTVNGKEVDPKSIGFNFDDPEHMGTAPGNGSASVGPNIGTKDATAGGAKEMAENYAQVDAELNKVNAAFATMTNADISKVTQGFREYLPILTQIEEKSRQVGDHPLTDEDKTDARNAALKKGLDLELAMAVAENSITNGVRDITPAINAVVAAAGPLGPLLAQQLQTEQAIAVNNRQEAADKQVLLDGEREHNQLLIDRRKDDENQQRQDYVTQYNDAASKRADDEAYTRAHWKIQDNRDTELRGIESAKTAEDDRWTVRSRQLEDEGRALDQFGTNQKQQLKDNLDNLDKQHKAVVASFTSQEQMLSGQVQGAGSRDSKNNLREVLAITKDYDRQTQQTYATQKEAIQDAITAEDKLASQQKYDFETAKLLETRAHEDEISRLDKLQKTKQQGYADDDKNEQRAKQNADWRAADTAAQDAFNHQQAMWNLQDKRNKEDEDYNAWHDGMTSRISDETEWGKKLDGDLALVKQMEADFPAMFASLGDGVAKVFAGVGISVDSPVKGPAPTYTNPRSTASTAGNPYNVLAHALGLPGYATGTDYATPGIHKVSEVEPEVIFKGGERVVPLSRFLRGSSASNGGGAAVGTQNINVNLSFDSGMASIFDAEAMSRMRAVAQQEAKRCLAQRRTTDTSASGGGRMTA